MTEQETLFEFPCEFPIKVMGKNHVDFEITVMTIVSKHVPDISEGALKTRPSSNGKFVSITVTIQAESKDQLDNIYRELSGHELVLMAL